MSKINGRLYTLARGERNRKAAHAEFHRVMTRIGAVEAQPGDLAIWALRDVFLDTAQADVGPDLFASYRQWTGRFVAFIGRSRLCASVIPHDVTRWLASPTKRRKPWSRSTKATAVKAIKRMYRWGKAQGLIDRNPLADVPIGGYEQRQCALTADQCRRVIDAATGPLKPFLEFLYETGCRPSEAIRLEARHVDLVSGTITMQGKTSRATGRARVIYLSTSATAILRPLVARHPSGHVFRNARGRPWNTQALADRMEDLRPVVGMGSELVPESFRHAYATQAAFRLLPAELAALMGSSVKTVSRYYLHMDTKTQELREAANRARN